MTRRNNAVRSLLAVAALARWPGVTATTAAQQLGRHDAQRNAKQTASNATQLNSAGGRSPSRSTPSGSRSTARRTA